jgi:hypothetical protein
MFIETLVASILAGKVRKGRLANLGELQLEKSMLLFIAILIQVGVEYLGRIKLGSAGLALHVGSYFLLFYFFWANKHTFNLLLPLGTFLNFLVILLNKGAMPVDPQYLPEASIEQLAFSVTHTMMTEAAVFPWLADIIYVKWPTQQLISAGDIIMNAGLFLFIQKVLLRK